MSQDISSTSFMYLTGQFFSTGTTSSVAYNGGGNTAIWCARSAGFAVFVLVAAVI